MASLICQYNGLTNSLNDIKFPMLSKRYSDLSIYGNSRKIMKLKLSSISVYRSCRYSKFFGTKVAIVAVLPSTEFNSYIILFYSILHNCLQKSYYKSNFFQLWVWIAWQISWGANKKENSELKTGLKKNKLSCPRYTTAAIATVHVVPVWHFFFKSISTDIYLVSYQVYRCSAKD